jgi:hypothetical protein
MELTGEWKKLAIWIVAPLLVWSCRDQTGSEGTTSSALFRPVFTVEAGDTIPALDFINSIEESNRLNFLSYPYLYNGGGVALGDLDNDGLTDVYLTGNMAGDRLYRNQGNLRFTDLTRPAGIQKQNLWTTGVTMADVNNDGYLDIYVCRSGDRGFRHNLLYINQGNFTFEEQARQWGVNDNGYSTQATFFDYDLDGDLDLYLVNHSIKFNFNQEEIFKSKYTPEPAEADQLYRNDGSHFTNVSQTAGIQRFAFGLSATVSDLNDDGYPDIYAASDFFEPDFLYLNQQDGTFKECLSQSIGHTSFSSMGSDIADYNNDGLPDIVVADMRAKDHYRYQANMVGMTRHKFSRMLKEGYHYQYMQNTLQLHRGVTAEGIPVFSELGQMAGISDTDWSWSTLLADLDNDGWKDLLITNGIRRDIQNKDAWTRIQEQPSPPSFLEVQEQFPVARLQNYTYRNNQQLGFTDVSSRWGINFSGFTNGAAYGDLDNDGDLDLLLNNLDDPAIIYENQTQGQHFLQLALRGQEDNHFGVGAKVTIWHASEKQFQELTLSRGFQSSVAPILHFGLGEQPQIDKLEVRWPNGAIQTLTNVKADQKITLNQQDSQPASDLSEQPAVASFLQSAEPFAFTHQERATDDFDREPLLPFTLSDNGPTMAVGDINGDQLVDVFMGNGAGYASEFFIQQAGGSFTSLPSYALAADKQYEDAAALLVDVDRDEDLDLYVVSGGYELEAGSALLKDRLYTNDGQGNFSPSALPNMRTNGSCVAAADFDQDGDIDLFVGVGNWPGMYPLPSPSFLLVNERGKFSPVELTVPGAVTDAVWADTDGDSDDDLVVVGHWMSIMVWPNDHGQLGPGTPLSIRDSLGNEIASSGWWNSITQADLDQDGDLDFVVGNEGLNTWLTSGQRAPLEIFASDFDQNGTPEAILTYREGDKRYPVAGRDKLLAQIPTWKRRFTNYHSYAQATANELLSVSSGDSVRQYQAALFASGVLYNEGGSSFTFVPLPKAAQISAINAAVVEDVNQDGQPDLIVAGNHYGWEVETARNDAGIGLCLLGDGQRNFRPLTFSQSGFFAPGDVRTLHRIQSVSGNTLLLAGRNQARLLGFRLPNTSELITLSNNRP